MIIYDIRCANDHRFEGWFANADAFAEQRQSGQIACPYCGTKAVERALSVPRIAGTGDRNDRQDIASKLADIQTAMLKDSTWVGNNFARRARAMADGIEPQTTIHGQATIQDAKDLHDDGIKVMPLPFPVIPPESRN